MSLCVSSNRFAVAILLAVKGGPSALSSSRAYFDCRTTGFSTPAPVLDDIVQNASGVAAKLGCTWRCVLDDSRLELETLTELLR